jgi:hypothetical protein
MERHDDASPQEGQIFPVAFVAAKEPTRFLNPSIPIEV